MKEPQVRSLGQEDPLEEEMATPSSILAWKISWTEEPDRLFPSATPGHDMNSQALGLARDFGTFQTI